MHIVNMNRSNKDQSTFKVSSICVFSRVWGSHRRNTGGTLTVRPAAATGGGDTKGGRPVDLHRLDRRHWRGQTGTRPVVRLISKMVE